MRKRNQRAGIKPSMLVNRRDDAGPGEVREAVTTETMPYVDRDPVACQQAKTLADVLDDPEQVTLWPKAAAELQRILNRLHDGGKPAHQRGRGRRLARSQATLTRVK